MLAVNLQGTFTQLLMLSDTQFIENVATPFSLPLLRPCECAVANHSAPATLVAHSGFTTVSYTHLTLPTICSV